MQTFFQKWGPLVGLAVGLIGSDVKDHIVNAREAGVRATQIEQIQQDVAALKVAREQDQHDWSMFREQFFQRLQRIEDVVGARRAVWAK